MSEKVNEHGSAPSDLKIYRHSSETARSENDSGGKVPVEHYTNKTSQPVLVRKTK